MDKLFKNGLYTKLIQGDVIHSPRELCKYIGKVEEGSIRLCRILRSGKEIVIKEFHPGDIFADLMVFSGEKYPGWFIASEDSVISEVDLSSLLNYLNEEDCLLQFLTNVSYKVSGLTNTIEVLSLKTVRQKIAYMLLYNSSKTESLTISTLASKIGSSREAVSRGISAMCRDNLISKEAGKVVIINQESLEDLFD